MRGGSDLGGVAGAQADVRDGVDQGGELLAEVVVDRTQVQTWPLLLG